MTQVERELRGMRAQVGRARAEVVKAEWALHCAKTAIYNALWRLGRSHVACEAIADELGKLQNLCEAPRTDLHTARARVESLALVIGAARFRA